jgi:hypothetical protein
MDSFIYTRGQPGESEQVAVLVVRFGQAGRHR